MRFKHGRTVYRIRAGLVNNPRSGDVRSDWTNPDVLEIPRAFIAQTSTSLLGGVDRQQAAESKSLFCEGTVDVQKGDRIRDGLDGPLYTIDGIPPAADTNPFTGWTPPREIPLTRYVG
jgi:hypothetical protein